jgi:hypothetical protein
VCRGDVLFRHAIATLVEVIEIRGIKSYEVLIQGEKALVLIDLNLVFYGSADKQDIARLQVFAQRIHRDDLTGPNDQGPVFGYCLQFLVSKL